MEAPPPPSDKPPGKIRTWWHPLLANLLRWQLGRHYRLQEEVPVGLKPLQIDLLLLQLEQGELPPNALRILAGLVEYFGERTLVEFKSPSDTLRPGDFQTFLAYALLYRAQNEPLLEPSRLHLLVVTPRLTRPYRDELRTLSVTAEPQERGIWRLQGGMVLHPTWVLETEVLAGLSHPLLTLFSPQVLGNGVETYELLHQGGYTEMVVYLAQQNRQFQLRGTEFAMQHLGTENEMRQAWRDLLATLTPEERLEGLSPEEMQRLVRDNLATLTPEDVLRGFTPEQRERLRQLLQPPPNQQDASSSPA
jgi:hypothetical protein